MTKEVYTKERPLRVFTAFSGYDSQCMALDRLGVPYVLIGWSEIDKYAIQAHNAIYPQWADRNAGDISKIDWGRQPDFDLFTYSFPCTDISNAGKQQGLSEDSGTRSSLLWECRKAIEIKRPKYLLMENVKNLVSKKFMPDFRRWEQWLAGQGYCNFYKVLNAKDYGVPQNRERVFMVSILDENASFHFPEPFPLEKKLKDVLEEDVDEKYYLSKKIIDTFIERNKINEDKGNGFKFEPTDGDCVASSVLTMPGSRPCDNYIKEPIACAMRGREVQCLTTKRTEYGKKVRKEYESGELKESRHNMTDLTPREDGIDNTLTSVQKDNLLLEVGNYIPPKGKWKSPQRGRVFSIDGISPTLDTMQRGNAQPKIIEPSERQRKIRVYIDDERKSGVSELQIDNENACASTVTTAHNPKCYGESTGYRIRKLTPRECFRLMDVSEEDIDRIQKAGISRSQQYKMAGNSIVVSCAYHIFRKMFIDTGCEGMHKTLF